MREGMEKALRPRNFLPTRTGEARHSEEIQGQARRLSLCSLAKARERLPLLQAERLGVLPLSLQESDGESLLLALSATAATPQLLQELRFLCGMPVILEPSDSAEILQAAIPLAYRGDETPLRMAADGLKLEPQRKKDLMPAIRPQAPIPLLLEALLVRAYYLGASDIHLEPQREFARLRFRVDGLLREETTVQLPLQSLENISRHVKVLCHLDVTEKRKPQDGSFRANPREGSMRVRVSFLPQHDTERIVFRLFLHEDERRAPVPIRTSLSELGLDDDQQQLLLRHLGFTGGTLVFSGPTGSGKTTLLYACLEHLNEEWRSVVTVEDPIERILPGVNQTQVSKSLGFSDFLPVLLRQDPDVVMVGEIRDAQTAETALTAGITGHLVLSSVHAGSCLEILPRLQYLGTSGLLLGSSLKLLSSQRLVPKNCPNCREVARGWEKIGALFSLPEGSQTFASKGCANCFQKGVQGRRGVFEFLAISPGIQEILLNAGPGDQAGQLLHEAKRQAHEEGFRPFAYQVREALMGGEISPSSACRALGVDPHLFSA